jgi:hypothetical protein
MVYLGMNPTTMLSSEPTKVPVDAPVALVEPASELADAQIPLLEVVKVGPEPVDVPMQAPAALPDSEEIDITGHHTLQIDAEDGVRGLRRLVYYASCITRLESEERHLRKLYDQEASNELHDRISDVHTKKWDMKSKHTRTLESLRETGRRRAKQSRDAMNEALMALPFPRPRKKLKTEPKAELEAC